MKIINNNNLPIIYIFTRFSIYDPNSKGFNLIHDKNYQEKLFSKQRLDKKFYIFKTLCLPHILEQEYTNWRWYIFISPKLPLYYKCQLIEMIKLYPQINIQEVLHFKEFLSFTNNIVNNQNNYITVRLDDDDGLSLEFLDLLCSYSKHKNSIVSFPYGTKVCLNNHNKLIYGKKMHQKNNAFGMAGINFNIFNAGNHCYVHRQYRVIYDMTPNMYYVFCDEMTDTKRKF